jgi:hypothetical protein
MLLRIRSIWFAGALAAMNPLTFSRCWSAMRSVESGRWRRGEVVRTRATALQMHTRQWIGTYAGRGNGDYRGELASALQAIITYLKHFTFPPEVALVRLDGQYGDAAVIAQIRTLHNDASRRWVLG